MPDRLTPEPSRRDVLTAILAVIVLLLVTHGLGRFIFTPLLPYLVDDGQISAQQGAVIATWNYLGYLIGALLAVRWHRIEHIRLILPLALAVHVLTTLAQTQLDQAGPIAASRLLNGVANGAVFVQAPALLLEWLVVRQRAALSGLVYIGVGAGLLLSSTLVTATSDILVGASRWWPAALISLPLAWWGVHRMRQLELPDQPRPKDGAPVAKTPLLDRASAPLFLAYAGAGLGYILPMTFLPLLARLQLPAGAWLIDGSWLIVALATLPSTWLWNYLGGRLGDLPALRLNFIVQLLGVLAAVILPGAVGVVLCAILVGGTFIGTVLLTQRVGRAMHPHQGPRLSAALVALYGFAQMAGPWLAKKWLDAGGTLDSAFWIGVIALALGLIFALMVPRPERWQLL